eukprot:1187757-Prorocentrum_minimum.AAC.2
MRKEHADLEPVATQYKPIRGSGGDDVRAHDQVEGRPHGEAAHVRLVTPRKRGHLGGGIKASGHGFKASGGGFKASGRGFKASRGGFETSGGGFKASGGLFKASGGGFKASGGGFKASAPTEGQHRWVVQRADKGG